MLQRLSFILPCRLAHIIRIKTITVALATDNQNLLLPFRVYDEFGNVGRDYRRRLVGKDVLSGIHKLNPTARVENDIAFFRLVGINLFERIVVDIFQTLDYNAAPSAGICVTNFGKFLPYHFKLLRPGRNDFFQYGDFCFKFGKFFLNFGDFHFRQIDEFQIQYGVCLFFAERESRPQFILCFAAGIAALYQFHHFIDFRQNHSVAV